MERNSISMKRLVLFGLIFSMTVLMGPASLAAIRGPKGFKETFCGKKICQWKNEKTDETVVYKKLPKNLATHQGTYSFSKKYLTNTRIGAKNLGYQILGSQVVKTTSKGSAKSIYFKSQFKKDGQLIWLNEKIVLNKNPILIQHYSPKGLKAQAALDQVR